MPNRAEHQKIGAAVGAAGSIVYQLIKNASSPNPPVGFAATIKRIDWGKVLVCAAGGMVVGTLADLLEPATSPNHRAFFHSVGFNGSMMCASFGPHSKEWEPESRELIQILTMSYVSHAASDSMTPKGIPWV